MRIFLTRVALGLLGLTLVSSLGVTRAAAQDPVLTPILVDTAVPIIVNAVKPKPKPGIVKFKGYVMHANNAQVTVRAMGNDMGVQTFSLSEQASAKMQQIIDKGGYQYGDRVTVYYDAQSLKAAKVKGKPSKPI